MANKKKMIAGIIIILLVLILTILFWPKPKHVRKKSAEERKYYILQDTSNNKEGVIDKAGNLIIEPNYEKVIIPNLSKTVFVISENLNTNEYKVLNDKNEQIIKNYNIEPILGHTEELVNEYRGVLKYKKDEKYGLLSIDGKELTKPIYDEIVTDNEDFYNYKVKINGKYGLLDENGTVIIQPEYLDIKSANKTIWENTGVKLGYELSKTTNNGIKYGFSDEYGNILVNPIYETVEKLEIPGNNYYIKVSENGKKGVFKNKNQILKPIYQEIAYTQKNIIIKKDGKYGMTNLEAKEIIAPRFNKYSSLETLVSFEDGENKYIYDENGKSITSGKYNIISTVPNKNYLILENYSGERLASNNEKTLADKFIDLTYVFDDKFIFYKDSKYGVASFEKGIIIESKYDYINLIQGTNILEATIGEDVDLYNSKIEKIQIPQNSSVEILNDEVAVIYNEEEKKYVDLKGFDVNIKDKLVLPAYSFVENGKYGFKTKDNNIVVKPEYDMVREFNKLGFASIKKDGKWGSINSKFEIVQEPKYGFNNTNILPKLLGKYLINSENGLFAIYTHE